MTVSDIPSKEKTLGNNVTVNFSFLFKVFDETNIAVSKIDINTNVSTPQILGVDYEVELTDEGDNGGTITYDVPPTSDEYSFIIRELSFTQDTDFPKEGKFPEEDIEDTVDKNTMLIQQVEEIANRSLQIPSDAIGFDPELPRPDAGKALLWNATSNAIENSTDNFNDIVTEANAAKDAAAISASDASASKTDAALSAGEALVSEGNAAISAQEAEAAAASLNIATPEPNKHGALLIQNDSDDGYDLLTTQGTTGQVFTSNGSDSAPSFSDFPNATETTVGGLEIATQAETDAGTDDTKAITPLKLSNALPFSQIYESSTDTYVAGTRIRYIHGFGVVPKLVKIELVMKVDAVGFTIGQIIEYTDSTSYGAIIVKTDTYIDILVSDAGWRVFEYQNPAAEETLTVADVDLRIKAYA